MGEGGRQLWLYYWCQIHSPPCLLPKEPWPTIQRTFALVGEEEGMSAPSPSARPRTDLEPLFLRTSFRSIVIINMLSFGNGFKGDFSLPVKSVVYCGTKLVTVLSVL